MGVKMNCVAMLAIASLALAAGCSDDPEAPVADSGATDTGGDTVTGADSGAKADGGGGTDSTAADAGSTDGGVAKDSGGSGKFQTCSAIGDCVVKDCVPSGFKAGCTDACFAKSENAALAKAAPLLTCVQDTCLGVVCKDSKDPNCLNDCMSEACIGPLLVCLDDGKIGDKPCPSVGSCMDNCSLDKPEPFKCMNACVNSLDKTGKDQVLAMSKCISAKGSIDKCFTETAACFTGGKTGDKPCGYMMSCTEACEKKAAGKEDDGQCMFGCLAEMSADGQKLFGELASGDCLGDDKGGEGKDETTPECTAALFKCIWQGQKGTIDCYQFTGCSETCVKEAVKAAGGTLDEAGMQKAEGDCMMKCTSQLKKDSQPLFLAVAACEDKKNDAKCDAAGMACIAPTGAANCAATGACIAKCPPFNPDDGLSGCTYECLHNAKDATAAGTMLTAMTVCKDDPENAKCLSTVKACAVPSGKDSCTSLFGCMGTCMGDDGGFKSLFCAVSCMEKGDTKAADALGALLVCQNNCNKECGGENDEKTCNDKCMGTKCKDEAAACPPPK